MFRRITSLLLVALMAVPTLRIEASTTVAARESEAKAAKVKAGIAKLGIGPDARVQLKLRNKTKLAGYISAVEDEFFVVTDVDNGQATTVSYPDVTQVQGNNLTTRTKVIIAASIIAGVIIVLYLVRGAYCDGC